MIGQGMSNTYSELERQDYCMNQELINTLKEECNKLYPRGCPIQPRGNSKTYLHLSHFLRWYAYQLYCQVYEHCNYEITLEMAHQDIEDFVIAQMPI
jgi:hypothetical protein